MCLPDMASSKLLPLSFVELNPKPLALFLALSFPVAILLADQELCVVRIYTLDVGGGEERSVVGERDNRSSCAEVI